jgi:hypothetical protein
MPDEPLLLLSQVDPPWLLAMGESAYGLQQSSLPYPPLSHSAAGGGGMGERRVLRHCRLANEADSPTSGARGGLSIRPLDSRTIQVVVGDLAFRLLRVFHLQLAHLQVARLQVAVHLQGHLDL